MDRRLELHEKLVSILGSSNVYYQPPESLKLKYPCIIYHKSAMDIRHANNYPYLKGDVYTINVLDKDPESSFPDLISDMPMCSFERNYRDEYINYWVFRLHF